MLKRFAFFNNQEAKVKWPEEANPPDKKAIENTLSVLPDIKSVGGGKHFLVIGDGEGGLTCINRNLNYHPRDIQLFEPFYSLI